MYTVILFYKYIPLESPENIKNVQQLWCKELGLYGRVLLASEGINATLEGTEEHIQEYIRRMESSDEFAGIQYKKSIGTGRAFPRLQVKVRKEVVTTRVEDRDLGPVGGVTGAYLDPQELHRWYESGKDFVVIDMRNDYEYSVGRFKNSIIPGELKNFRDLPKILPQVEDLKDKTVVTVCTGGIRCEKASGFLKKNGFSDVYQLHHGMHTYLEQFPDGYFEGKLYVFDERKLWHPRAEDAATIGQCEFCQAASENVINWYDSSGQRRHGIVCTECLKAGVVIEDGDDVKYTYTR
jgi:UPF0176 protein